VIIHERAKLYGAENYLTLKTLIDLTDWKNQESIYQRDLVALIQHTERTQVDYMEALRKECRNEFEKEICRQTAEAV